MIRPSLLNAKSLEVLVRTALSSRELSPGVAAEINRYRTSAQLTQEEHRYLAILEDAITDGCIQPVGLEVDTGVSRAS
jgi:hypothetical protein